MVTSNFPETDLAGQNETYRDAVEDIHLRYGFDFVALGMTAFLGAPLKWVYGAGASNERYKRIVLAPGHGIGGIVIKSGKPMMFLDIDDQIDPREYSSYPIVFAEDLRSFCALPLLKKGRVVGSLLCAYRSVDPEYEHTYRLLIDELGGTLLDLDVRSDDFLYFDAGTHEDEPTGEPERHLPRSAISQIIMAQEDERRRISRELHDGIAQELLSVSFSVRQLRELHPDDQSQPLFSDIEGKIDSIMGELHSLSVELRPSTLDNLGIAAALKSRAAIFEKSYGTNITFHTKLSQKRLDRVIETQVYRICQEAMLNACKYSGADTVSVELEDADGWLCATIRDKGHGFNVAQPEIKGSGCGLAGIQERASLIGANLRVESGENGTTVTLIAPLMTPAKDTDD